jgi:adenine-specific DNA methylase
MTKTELARVIRERVSAVLEANNIYLCRLRISSADTVDGDELEEIMCEIGDDVARTLTRSGNG